MLKIVSLHVLSLDPLVSQSLAPLEGGRGALSAGGPRSIVGMGGEARAEGAPAGGEVGTVEGSGDEQFRL